MIGLFSSSTAAVMTLALVFGLLVTAVIALDNPNTQRLLRRYPWYRRFERLSPSELRFRGMVSLGFGVCCFAALLTLRLLFPSSNTWPTLALAITTIVAITLGAALLEKAEPL